MWLPRLRLTLVSPLTPPPPAPHSSRSPFGKIFVNFVRTDVQPRLRFSQARWRTREPPFAPSLGEEPSRPMAFPRHHKIIIKQPPGDSLASRSICPGPPRLLSFRQRRVRGTSSRTRCLSRPGVTQRGVPSPGRSHTLSVAFLTPTGKTKQPLAPSRALLGLIQTKPRQAFAFLSSIYPSS